MAQGAGEGILEGIGEGLGQIGDQIRQGRERDRAARDLEADNITEQIKSIADNIQRVGGKDTPEGQQLSTQLTGLVQKHNALFPPHEAPALIQRLQKLLGHKPGTPRPDPRASMSSGDAMAAAPRPAYNTTDTYLRHQNTLQGEFATTNADVQTKIDQARNDATIRWARENGIPEDAVQELIKVHAGIPATLLKPIADKSGQWEDITGTLNGKRVTLHHSKATNETTDFQGNPIDPEVLKAFVPDDKFAPVKNKQLWIMRDGKPLSVMADANNQPIPGTENPNAIPPPSLVGRMTTTSVYMDDGFGNIIELPKTTISGPVGTGGAAPPNSVPVSGAGGLPKTPAEARALMPPPGGRVAASKASKPYNEAKINRDKAAGIVELAKAAAQKKTALSDRNLAIRMAREASGRFSMAEYDTMIKSAGLGNTFEQWMNNLTSGALPDNIRNQLISVANDNLAAADAELKSAGGGPAGTGDDPLGILH